jgi:hypothetical protein
MRECGYVPNLRSRTGLNLNSDVRGTKPFPESMNIPASTSHDVSYDVTLPVHYVKGGPALCYYRVYTFDPVETECVDSRTRVIRATY